MGFHTDPNLSYLAVESVFQVLEAPGVLRKGAGTNDEDFRRPEHLNALATSLLKGMVVADEGHVIVAGGVVECHCVAVGSCEKSVDVVQGMTSNASSLRTMVY